MTKRCVTALEELSQHEQWVVWRTETRNGKPTKVPYHAAGKRAKANDPRTWLTHEQAVRLAPQFDGIGFVFTKNDPYVFVDIDNVALTPFGRDLISRLRSYAELSPSNKGAHIIVRGCLPTGHKNKLLGLASGQKHCVEFYSRNRYATWTGEHIPDSPVCVELRQTELDALYADVVRLDRLSEKMRRLFVTGDCSAYPSQSEADCALFGAVLRLTDGDRDEAMRLLHQSSLDRDKWDRADYVKMTFDKAKQTNQKPVIVRALIVTPFSEIEEEEISWLWEERIAFGKLTLILGNPGVGKSVWNAWLAAALSKGLALPGTKTTLEPLSTLMVFVEDGAADTVKPRLRVHGADMSKVFRVQATANEIEDLLTLPDDLPLLRPYIEQHAVKVVQIDPLSAFLSGNLNTWNDANVRQALAPMAQLAEETGAAFIGSVHLNKKSSVNVLDRAMGSIAFTGVARSNYLIGIHPEDVKEPEEKQRKIFAPAKRNIGRPVQPRIFTLEDRDGVPQLVWGRDCSFNAEAILTAGITRESPKLEQAIELLKSELSSGKRPAAELYKLALERGISDRSLRRAKEMLDVESVRVDFGKEQKSWWEMPAGSVTAGASF